MANDSIKADQFVPLHCHSFFSVLDGLDSPEAMARRFRELGHKAGAITDHGSCAGLFRFQKACNKEGIKPILGMEAYIVEDITRREKGYKPNHLTLWAKDETGYKNLVALGTYGNLEGFYSRPRISYEKLAECRAGLIAGSACIQGVFCRNEIDGKKDAAIAGFQRLKDLFGEDFYAEVMHHTYTGKKAGEQKIQLAAMKALLEVADKTGVKPIYTYDSHYCNKADAYAHDVLLCINRIDTIKNPDRFGFSSDDFYMKSVGEIMEVCSRRPDLVTNTLEVADKISENIIKTTPFRENLPRFEMPPGVTDELQYLKSLIRSGMMKREIFNIQEYRDRIVHELKVIEKCGFVRYFLVLWDICDYARRSGIKVGPGRGSGAASLCLYCLNVTQLDPIKHVLLFERFLNPDRISPPDVDLDFDDSKQGDMFRYVSERHGPECVARIGTYNTLGARDAIRRVAKALDVGNDWEASGCNSKNWKSGRNTLRIADEISKSIPNTPGIKLATAIKESVHVKRFSKQYPKLFEIAQRVEGTIVSEGVHAAGVIICSRPITQLVPLRVARSKNSTDEPGVVCTQFDMNECEGLGLLKYDFLGLTNLRVEELCMKLIKERTGKEYDLNTLPLDDEKTFTMISNGEVDGIFQLDQGGGMRELMRNMKVDRFDDLSVGIALYRPGAIAQTGTYCECKHGRKSPNSLHPLMDELLSETYGIMVFQEQVMMISMKMAGFSASEADLVRKAMGKKKPEVMAKLKEQFVQGFEKTSGIDPSTGSQIFDMIDKFAGYGFNKAHSASYALLGYQNAWLKAHYPLEYMCALLCSNMKKEDKIVRYEGACKRICINILPCHLNYSKDEYRIEGNGIRRPMTALKGVGAKSVQAIVDKQPYHSLQEFVDKVGGNMVDRKTFEILVSSGCMDCLGMTNRTLLSSYDAAKELSKKKIVQMKKEASLGTASLFDCNL